MNIEEYTECRELVKRIENIIDKINKISREYGFSQYYTEVTLSVNFIDFSRCLWEAEAYWLSAVDEDPINALKRLLIKVMDVCTELEKRIKNAN